MDFSLLGALPDWAQLIIWVICGIGIAFAFIFKYVRGGDFSANDKETILHQQELIKQLREERAYEREQRLQAEKKANEVMTELYKLRAKVESLEREIQTLNSYLGRRNASDKDI